MRGGSLERESERRQPTVDRLQGNVDCEATLFSYLDNNTNVLLKNRLCTSFDNGDVFFFTPTKSGNASQNESFR